MKNSIGNSVILTIFGESHGPFVGAVLDGLAPGLVVDEGFIAECLKKRRPSGRGESARVEKDDFRIVSGVKDGLATGTPLAVLIPNENVRSTDYQFGPARPSHADLTAQMKYHGFQDTRGGGHFSGRVTAAIVAAGAICLDALRRKGILIGSHILSCGPVNDRPFGPDVAGDLSSLSQRLFPVLDAQAGERMQDHILSCASEGDSAGGVIQTAVCGMPQGVGEPWFDSLEGDISRAMFALGGVKGIEFGSGFALCAMKGSEANDPLRYTEDGSIVSLSNHNGGINGGISNGSPIVFSLAVKPTPSIFKPQQSVDFIKGENIDLSLKGRHDPAIVRRICPVVDALLSIVLCDCLAQRFGTDYLK